MATASGNNHVDHCGRSLDGERSGGRARMVMLSSPKCLEINTSLTVLSMVRVMSEQQYILECMHAWVAAHVVLLLVSRCTEAAVILVQRSLRASRN